MSKKNKDRNNWGFVDDTEQSDVRSGYDEDDQFVEEEMDQWTSENEGASQPWEDEPGYEEAYHKVQEETDKTVLASSSEFSKKRHKNAKKGDMTDTIEENQEVISIFSDDDDVYNIDEIEDTEKREMLKSNPKKVWKMARPVAVFLISLGIVIVALLIGYQFVYTNYFAPVDSNDSNAIEVTIEKGSSVNTIAETLEEKGLVRNATVFKFYVDFSDMASKLKAGTYKLSPNMTMEDIAFELKSGNNDDAVIKFTATEGMTIEDIADVLVEKGVLTDKDRFLELCKTGSEFSDYEYIGEVLALQEGSTEQRRYALEGYLFPDTYEVFKNTSEESIIRKMLDQFNKVYNDEFYFRTEDMDMTVDDVVKMASLIEREAKPKDFKKVAACFYNRLEDGQNLESCATLQYYLRLDKYVFNEEERATDTQYNTYKNGGLPLGPIANPGKQAMEAALYPSEEYLNEGYKYFCLKDPETGELAFAKTYEEHLANVEKYSSSWN